MDENGRSATRLRRSGWRACRTRGALLELAAWLDRLLGPEDQDGRRHSPRIRDLHHLAFQHYFHPRMGGRTSIKVVLTAVWEFQHIEMEASDIVIGDWITQARWHLAQALGREQADEQCLIQRRANERRDHPRAVKNSSPLNALVKFESAVTSTPELIGYWAPGAARMISTYSLELQGRRAAHTKLNRAS